LVYDSWEWKRELREKKKEILRYNTKENFDHHFDSIYFKVERALLYSATIIRILIESQKLSDDIDQYKINVSKNEPIKHIDRLHRWLDEDEYNWDNTAHEKVYGKNVCNWLIHSYVFRFQFDDNGVVSGFFVSSDYDRNKALYTISLADWINFVDSVITDDVVELVATFDDKRSDYIYRIKKRGKRRVLKP